MQGHYEIVLILHWTFRYLCFVWCWNI